MDEGVLRVEGILEGFEDGIGLIDGREVEDILANIFEEDGFKFWVVAEVMFNLVNGIDLDF